MSSDEKSVGSDQRDTPLGGAPLADLLSQLERATPARVSVATAEIIRRFEPLIRKFWWRQRCGDYDDFLQDVLLRLFSSLPQLRDSQAFPGFMRRIVITTAAEYWRKQSVHDEHLTGVDIESVAYAFDQDMTTPLVVRTYLDRLPTREREIIELSYLEDLDSTEIAQRTGLSPGSVRMTKSRAIHRLRELFASEEG